MGKCFLNNHLEGENAASLSFASSFLLWIFIYIFLLKEKEKNEENEDNKDKIEYELKLRDFDIDEILHDIRFYLLCGSYVFYLITQFVTGFRQFIKLQNFRDILSNNIENKFSIIFHGKAWHEDHSSKNTKNVVTYDRKIIYDFKSGADFSTIIIDSESIKNKSYFDLEIEIEYICLDDKTKKNHDNYYKKYYDLTKSMDKEFSFEKIVDIPKTHSKNIISLTNSLIIYIDRILLIIFYFFVLRYIL
jgi:hypothetical protein